MFDPKITYFLHIPYVFLIFRSSDSELPVMSELVIMREISWPMFH